MTENTNQTNHAQDIKNRLQAESAALAWLECGDRPIPANDTRHAVMVQ